MSAPVMLLAPEDDVVVALRRLETGATVAVGGRAITVGEPIGFAHKLAIRDIPEGARVRKFGVPIGRAVRPIRKGEHVHVHNLESTYVVNATDFYEEDA